VPPRPRAPGGRLRQPDRTAHKLTSSVSEPVPTPSAIDDANARLSTPRTLDELMAGVPVLESWDQLDIPDLTDEEREAFAAALADRE